MKISAQRIQELCQNLGIVLAWGEDEFMQMVYAVMHLEECVGPDKAKEFWVLLLMDELDDEQKVRVAMQLYTELGRVCGEGSAKLMEDGKVMDAATLQTMGLALISRSARFLRDIVAKRDDEMSEANTFTKAVMDDVFGLPWCIDLSSYSGTGLSSVMYRMGKFIGEMGIGPVGYDDKLRVHVPVEGAQGGKDIHLWFGRRDGKAILLGHSNPTSKTIWVYADGMDPAPITPNIERLSAIASYLELSPALSLSQIREVMSRLTFSFLRPS